MKYYIPSLDVFVDNSKDVTLASMEPNPENPEQLIAANVVYPRNSIPSFFPDAVAKPVPGAYEKIEEGAGGWQVTPFTQEEADAYDVSVRASKTAQAWTACNDLCLLAADHNSRAKYLIWLMDDTSSATRKTMIEDVNAWMDQVWQVYGVFKATLAVDISAEMGALPDISTCPYDFWAIAGA